MSKSNVNPNHYKVAGRERQGEDILQERHKQKHAQFLARERFEPRQTTPPQARLGQGAQASPEPTEKAPARKQQRRKRASARNQQARKKAPATRRTEKTPVRGGAKRAQGGAKKKAPARSATRSAARKRSAASKRPAIGGRKK